MKNGEFSRRIAGLSLAALASLGLVACSSSKGIERPTPSSTAVSKGTALCPTPNDQLQGLHILGRATNGGVDAINTGICTELFDPITGKDAGRGLAQNEHFKFICVLGPKPYFEVETSDGTTGNLLFSQQLEEQLQQGANSDEALLAPCSDSQVL